MTYAELADAPASVLGPGENLPPDVLLPLPPPSTAGVETGLE